MQSRDVVGVLSRPESLCSEVAKLREKLHSTTSSMAQMEGERVAQTGGKACQHPRIHEIMLVLQ